MNILPVCTTAADVIALCEKAIEWGRVGDDVLLVIPLDDGNEDEDYVYLGLDNFALIHPAFPTSITTTLAERERLTGNTVFSVVWLKCLLSYYTGPQVVPCRDGVARHILTVDRFYELPTPSSVKVGVESYTVKSFHRQDVGEIVYIDDYDFKLVHIDAAWFDTRYPGWRERLLTAQSLDITGQHELASILCMRVDTPAATLPDLTGMVQ